MSMPYHKELLRSSVSLCFREFFVFRNKAKGVMTLLCQFEKMIYPSGTGAADAASFMIALYRPCEKLKDSSGNTITQIKAVGYCLPTAGNMRYEMRGHWRKDPKYGIQYDVEGDVLIAVIIIVTTNHFFIHSMPSWHVAYIAVKHAVKRYVFSLLWWHAQRRHGNGPQAGIPRTG